MLVGEHGLVGQPERLEVAGAQLGGARYLKPLGLPDEPVLPYEHLALLEVRDEANTPTLS